MYVITLVVGGKYVNVERSLKICNLGDLFPFKIYRYFSMCALRVLGLRLLAVYNSDDIVMCTSLKIYLRQNIYFGFSPMDCMMLFAV